MPITFLEGARASTLTIVKTAPAVFNMWPCNNVFSHQSLIIWFFSNPTNKTKIGTAIRWEIDYMESTHSTVAHIEDSIWLANENHGTGVKSYLKHSSSLAGVRLCSAFHQPLSKECQNAGAKTILQALLHLIQDFQCRVTFWAPVEML